jgi:hypothetical protein
MPVLGSLNSNIERNSRGFLYVVPIPAVLPAGVNLAAKYRGYFDQFLAAASWTELKAGLNPWANITSEGLALKVKQNRLSGDSQAQAKHDIGIIDTDVTAEFTIIDVEPKKFADSFSLDVDELISVAAAAGAPGFDLAALGGQTTVARFMALWRAPDQAIPGQYEMFLLPRITISGDTDLKLNKKDRLEGKLILTSEEDFNLVNAKGHPEKVLYFKPNAAAL